MPRPTTERSAVAPRTQGWLRLSTSQGFIHYLNLEQVEHIRFYRDEATFSVVTESGLAEIGCFVLSFRDRRQLNAALYSPESGWIEVEDTGDEQRYLHFSLVVRVDYASGTAGPLLTTRNGRQVGRVTSPGGQARLRRLLAHAGIAADLEADERPSPVVR